MKLQVHILVDAVACRYACALQVDMLQLDMLQVHMLARFTSRPEARGSGPEAVFRFLGLGVDSRGEKGKFLRSALI